MQGVGVMVERAYRWSVFYTVGRVRRDWQWFEGPAGHRVKWKYRLAFCWHVLRGRLPVRCLSVTEKNWR
jgi:hypothetical protein